jgi:hypothetical protein
MLIEGQPARKEGFNTTAEARMSKKARAIDKISKREVERQKHQLDRQLDRELEGTFPASDAPKITRTPHHASPAKERLHRRFTIDKQK